jgi:glycogen debranching enzyme
MPERGYYAIALDRDKRQVDACASNIGHCLWLGLVDEDIAPLVAERLMSPEMFSGWGVRTLAADMGAHNPASYHNGSVWPHDNAIAAAGLLRYGFVAEAQRIATALLEAAGYSGGRLPELFCGFSRDQAAEPVPYPTACSPQAWAATTPTMLVTRLIRYDAHVSRVGL